MPQISFTVFVEFTVSEPFKRLSRVKQAVDNQEYNPCWDFWKGLREGIQEMHQSGLGMNHLDSLVQHLTDEKKKAPYAAAVAGYRQWIRNRRPQHFTPPRADWSHQGLTVRVNPEVGLQFGAARHAIKLYFLKDPLSQRRADISLALMEEALRPHTDGDVLFGVLDVQRSRLYEPRRQVPGVGALLRGEAASFLEIWNSLTDA